MLVDYLIGVPYLYYVLKFLLHQDINIMAVVKKGFLIFVPGDLLKCILASMLAVKVIPRLRDFKS